MVIDNTYNVYGSIESKQLGLLQGNSMTSLQEVLRLLQQ